MRALLTTTSISGAALLAFCGGPTSGTKDAQAAWEPKKPVEFIVMAGKGGGADKAVRLMQSIIAKNKLSSKPFTPINKPGGSGAEALVHVKNARDPNHTIMFTLNSFYTTPLRQPGLGVDIATFTPVARMAEDTFLLWVHKDMGINTFDEFLAEAKKRKMLIQPRTWQETTTLVKKIVNSSPEMVARVKKAVGL